MAERLHGLRRRRVARDVVLLSALAALTVLLLGTGPAFGATTTALPEVLHVLAGDAMPGVSFAVVELRLTRAIGALLAGAAFGVGGMLFQTLLRNVLASPT